MTMKLLVLSGLLGFFLLTVLIPVCRAGMVIEEIHRDMEGKMSRVIRYFSEDRFRTDHPEGGLSTIIDFKGDSITLIDHFSRSYVEIKFSRWEKEVSERLKKSMPGMKSKEKRFQ